MLQDNRTYMYANTRHLISFYYRTFYRTFIEHFLPNITFKITLLANCSNVLIPRHEAYAKLDVDYWRYRWITKNIQYGQASQTITKDIASKTIMMNYTWEFSTINPQICLNRSVKLALNHIAWRCLYLCLKLQFDKVQQPLKSSRLGLHFLQDL